MLSNKTIQNFLIIIMLGLLTVSAFFVRLDNFNKSWAQTIDEIVYARMGRQMVDNFFDYNSIPYGEQLSSKGRSLPRYFFEPLFKHPPLFSFLISVSMKIFGKTLESAEYVSLLLAVLMIPLIFFLGTLIADKKVGILAAVLLWLDPVSIICSQKIWMDTPISFFTLLTAVLFVYGLKNNNDLFFIYSGIASGLAVNTKYTGILITFSIILFALFYRKALFLNRKFNFSLLLPVILLIPWFIWNLNIYGFNSISKHSELLTLKDLLLDKGILLIAFVLIVIAGYYLYRKLQDDFGNKGEKQSQQNTEVFSGNDSKVIKYISIPVIVVFLVLFVGQNLINSFQFDFLPKTTWRQGVFANESASFYFGRLIEFFLVYVFAFISLFLYQPQEKEERSYVRISAVVILLFFILWRNYQSRYILSSIPFLLILSADMITKIDAKIYQIKSFLPRVLSKSIFYLILSYMFFKVYHLNTVLSYTNDMCYF